MRALSNKNYPVVCDINYHLIWHTKNRADIPKGAPKSRLSEILKQDCEYKGIKILGGKVGVNFVHLIVSCPPKLAVSEIIKSLKGRSSRMLSLEFPDIVNLMASDSFWDAGYLCQSFGDVNDAVLTNYATGSEQ